jgi:hypothetical protein
MREQPIYRGDGRYCLAAQPADEGSERVGVRSAEIVTGLAEDADRLLHDGLRLLDSVRRLFPDPKLEPSDATVHPQRPIRGTLEFID